MSGGIAGILNLDGAPADRRLLEQLVRALAHRGPDGQQSRLTGPVGFGFSQSGQSSGGCFAGAPLWIVADARLDGRAELAEKLAVKAPLSDAELILSAYRRWGEGCATHLLGDFAFAIWDGSLFCARDQLGVKPFFYTQVGQSLLFSSELAALRLHPALSNRIDELAVADFLLFGCPQQLDITPFAAIRRLPPAHTLGWQPRQPVRISRYWELPVAEPIFYRRRGDYIEHFRELFDRAVGDRLGDGPVAISMSGGMDSTSVAATARTLLSRQGNASRLWAHTCVYDRLIPDSERHWAALAARHLEIAVHYQIADRYCAFEGWDRLEGYLPEPCDHPLWLIDADQCRQIAASGGRVLLTGQGGDSAFCAENTYGLYLLRQGGIRRAAGTIGSYLVEHGRLPPLGIRTFLKSLRRQEPAGYPDWLNRDFAARLDLPGRWRQLSSNPPAVHPFRPRLHRMLRDPFWPSLFESYDPAWTHIPVEVRHPFFDLRLLEFLLAIPPVPWCVHKQLLREAMGDRLPEAVRQRPKTPLAARPVHPYAPWVLGDALPVARLGEYVDMTIVSTLIQGTTCDELNDTIQKRRRLIALNYWLKYTVPSVPIPTRSRP
ncbi:asparagine synthetase B family protein [Gloeobacter kilaueensis]|uniref:asparagine synthase (glutamine-hydrolyzing) n=1 Tax=Gloeobacter kilaueensis (strain ATCC BAA-2537 / CCAP 1431/1 / ULC 316 / JS1) TaxID=1183438 RepID=U5QHR7_GLOK1|nr:asparagine synthase-related protein [Gloeobacter kilaueensis]AGY58408.1 asparagine synthase [Gloeobacter kilaueensis JS1]